MSEPTTPSGQTTQTPPTGTSPEQTATTPPPAPTPPAAKVPLAEVPADQLDPVKLRDLVLKQRADDAAKDAELKALRASRDELDALKRAQETDAEKLKREHDEAVANAGKAQEALRRGYLLAELAKQEHGIVDAEAAATLIDGVEYGDDGKPTNAAERIAALLETKAFLKATPTAPVTPAAPNVNGGSGTGGAAPPALTAEQVAWAKQAGMAPEKYAEWVGVSNITQVPQPSSQ